MPIIKRVALKDFNPGGLLAELLALALPLRGVGFDGFDLVIKQRHVTPAPAPKVVGRDKGVPIDTAAVGEVRLHANRALTAPEDIALDAALAAHDQTVLSAEQVRQDTDESDIDGVLATGRQEFLDVLGRLQVVVDGWDGASTPQRMAATKASIDDTRTALIVLGKIMRFILREERKAAI